MAIKVDVSTPGTVAPVGIEEAISHFRKLITRERPKSPKRSKNLRFVPKPKRKQLAKKLSKLRIRMTIMRRRKLEDGDTRYRYPSYIGR